MNSPPAACLDPTTVRKAKRILVAMAGGTVLALGMALVVLPGPAFLVIPAGLAILAVEFGWAKRWLCKARALLPKKGPAGHGCDGRKQSDPSTIQTAVQADRDGNPGSHGPAPASGTGRGSRSRRLGHRGDGT